MSCTTELSSTLKNISEACGNSVVRQSFVLALGVRRFVFAVSFVASFLYQTSFLARIRHVKIEENLHYSYGLCQEQPSSQDLSFSAQT